MRGVSAALWLALAGAFIEVVALGTDFYACDMPQE